MARIPIDGEEEDPRFEIPDGPSRLDLGLWVGNVFHTIANVLDEISDLADSTGGMIAADFAARRQERYQRQLTTARMEAEAISDTSKWDL